MSKKPIVDKKHNIKVAPDSGNVKPDAHRPAADGKAEEDVNKKMFRDMEIEFMTKHFCDLRKAKVKCDFVVRDGMKVAVIGDFKRHPFAVYSTCYSFQNQWAMIVTTRYKGKDVEMKPPLKVLKEG